MPNQEDNVKTEVEMIDEVKEVSAKAVDAAVAADEKVERAKEDLDVTRSEIAAVKEDVSAVKEDVGEIKEDVKSIQEQIDVSVQRNTPIDQQVYAAFLAAMNGEGDTLLRALPAGALSELKAQECLSREMGYDMEDAFLVKEERAKYINVSVPVRRALENGLSSSTEWLPSVVKIECAEFGFYDYWDLGEGKVATLDRAKEAALDFIANRNLAYKTYFVSGDGSFFYGVTNNYTRTQSMTTAIASSYIYETSVGAAATASALQVYNGIIDTANTLTEDGQKQVFLHGSTLTQMQTNTGYSTTGNTAYFYQLLLEAGIEPVRLDTMTAWSSLTSDSVAGIVNVKGRGYVVGKNPDILTTQNDTAAKREQYIGQAGLGGRIADFKSIGLVVVDSSNS